LIFALPLNTFAKSATASLRRILQADKPPQAQASSYERFAIPYSFKPRLSVGEAVVFASSALLQILLSSLLFAVCGTYAVVFWQTIHNIFLRLLAVLAAGITFLILFPLLLIAIRALQRLLIRQS
jgi:hypothetical protein